jgi:hypothetical protein
MTYRVRTCEIERRPDLPTGLLLPLYVEVINLKRVGEWKMKDVNIVQGKSKTIGAVM